AVDRGGVDQIAAGIEVGVELVTRLVLVGLTRPGPRPEAQVGDLETGGAEAAQLHAQNIAAAARGSGERLARLRTCDLGLALPFRPCPYALRSCRCTTRPRARCGPRRAVRSTC